MLPAFMANLLVRDVARAIPFYRDVLGGVSHYSDPDFAAVKVGGAELMLHADHTYDKHPWHERLVAGERRGLGAELRLFGIDPDAVEARAAHGVAPARDAPER
jgi:catechol 2,3-dioxygenase-like lactoylglutathione lyase family enzyme